MKVIFLDFDGVLNSREYNETLVSYGRWQELSDDWWREGLDPSAITVLNTIIERTGALVVVSSSWRHGTDVVWLQRILDSRGFVGEVIDVTPDFGDRPRRDEIQAWLDDHEVDSFVILDDDADASIHGHFIHTNSNKGLTPKNADLAVKVLHVQV